MIVGLLRYDLSRPRLALDRPPLTLTCQLTEEEEHES